MSTDKFYFFDHSNELVIRSSNDINYTGISSYRQHLLQKKLSFLPIRIFITTHAKIYAFQPQTKRRSITLDRLFYNLFIIPLK